MAPPVIRSSGLTDTSSVSPAYLGFLVTVFSGVPTAWEWTCISTPMGLAEMRGVKGDFTNGVATVANPSLTCFMPGGYSFQVRAANADGWSRSINVELNALVGTVPGEDDADIAAHAALTTGVHGVGVSPVASAATVAAAVATHAALVSDVHGLIPSAAVDRDIYISNDLGVDTNDGLTKLTPLKTISGYFLKYGTQLASTSKVRINLAGSGGADPWVASDSGQEYTHHVINLPESHFFPNALVFRGPQMIRASLGGGVPTTAVMDNPPARTINAAGAADAAGLRTEILCTGAAPAWPVNICGPNNRGAFLRITRAGVKRIFELPIADNTADTIIVDTLGIVGNIAFDDTMEIVTPAIGIYGPTDIGGARYPVKICGQGGLPSSIVAAPVAADQGFTFERISLGGNTGPLVFGAVIVSFDRCKFMGGTTIYRSWVYLANCSCIGQFECDSADVYDLEFSRPDGAADPATVTAGTAMMSRTVAVTRGGTFDVSKRPLSCYRYTDHGIYLKDGGMFNQRDGCPFVGGDGHTNTGIFAEAGGRARIRGIVAGVPRTTMTGAGGALQLGAGGAAVAYGTGAGAFEEVAGYAGNLHDTYVDAGGVTHGDFSQIRKV